MMDARTRKALDESIAHWERNVAAETPDDANIGGGGCALCCMFLLPRNILLEQLCNGCPVYGRTGKKTCQQTPYGDAKRAFFRWRTTDQKSKRAAFRLAAQAELDFLRSLLPEGER